MTAAFEKSLVHVPAPSGSSIAGFDGRPTSMRSVAVQRDRTSLRSAESLRFAAKPTGEQRIQIAYMPITGFLDGSSVASSVRITSSPTATHPAVGLPASTWTKKAEPRFGTTGNRL